MPKRSAGLVMFRWCGGDPEVLLVHPGGPFYAKKDLGAWSIPKGEFADGDDPLEAAQREFTEETGFVAAGDFIGLGEVRQAGGKIVSAWGVAGDCDPAQMQSNTFEMEWPPRSGKRAEFPEVDRAAWYSIEEGKRRLLESQAVFLDRLAAILTE